MPPYRGHDKLLLQVDDSNRNDGLSCSIDEQGRMLGAHTNIINERNYG